MPAKVNPPCRGKEYFVDVDEVANIFTEGRSGTIQWTITGTVKGFTLDVIGKSMPEYHPQSAEMGETEFIRKRYIQLPDWTLITPLDHTQYRQELVKSAKSLR